MAATFELALIWTHSESAQAACDFVRSLAEQLPREKLTRLEFRPRVASAVIDLELDFSLYGRNIIQGIEKTAERCGGKLVEILRLREEDREPFRKQHLSAQGEPALSCESYSQAATALQAHFKKLPGQAPTPAATPAATPTAAPSTKGGGPSSGRGLSGSGASSPASPSAAPRRADPPAAAEQPRIVRSAPAKAASAPPTLCKREAPRFPVQLAVGFKTESEFRAEYTANVSKGGVFVRTKARPAQNTMVELKLELPNGQELKTVARVVHCFEHPEHGGVGLAFEKSDSKFQADLAAYLESLPKA